MSECGVRSEDNEERHSNKGEGTFCIIPADLGHEAQLGGLTEERACRRASEVHEEIGGAGHAGWRVGLRIFDELTGRRADGGSAR